MPNIRTFVALEIPQTLREDIRNLQKNLLACGLKIRWVKPENMHLTLKFLGDVHPEKIDHICSVITVAVANCPVFQLIPSGVGCFPSVKRARILWVGVSGAFEWLKSLQASVENALEPLGFAAETRPYRGHLTIGRIKSHVAPKNLADALRSQQNFESETFSVKHVALFQSVLQPSGPVYTRLRHIPLGIC
jgi:RNA 2',3'-cyclic 3'-phosphodiesterase